MSGFLLKCSKDLHMLQNVAAKAKIASENTEAATLIHTSGGMTPSLHLSLALRTSMSASDSCAYGKNKV